LIPKYMGYAIKTILLFIEWLTTKYCAFYFQNQYLVPNHLPFFLN